MRNQVQQRELGNALAAALRERDGAERYRRYMREIRSGTARRSEGARPLQFDERGFPLAQRSPSFLERVARLLNPL